jgi:hypothetical protein
MGYEKSQSDTERKSDEKRRRPTERQRDREREREREGQPNEVIIGIALKRLYGRHRER